MTKNMKSVKTIKTRKTKLRRKKKTLAKNVWKLSRSLKQHFPPVLRAKLTVNCSLNVNPATNADTTDFNGYYALFKGNSILACGPAKGSTGLAIGAYSINYPAGIDYLLGNQNPGNTIGNATTAPYSRVLVLQSSIIVRLMDASLVAGQNGPIRVVLCPFSGDPQALVNGISQGLGNFREQPDSKDLLMSGQITSSKVPTLKHKISTRHVYGINKNVTTDDAPYVHTYIAGPTNPWTWILGFNNADGTTNTYNICGEVIITYDCLFFDRNIFKSVAPS